jgi:hypothetical protein
LVDYLRRRHEIAMTQGQQTSNFNQTGPNPYPIKGEEESKVSHHHHNESESKQVQACGRPLI